ncbi:hypothetical protein CK203_054162 [Vitis vinifera]|uniref:phosphatidate cytidylyltransferase n=1 Tax=Vitis vinifera TaxID=29760 RepID=A0A438FU91_VITVI|nr:hypothetical protein CK203_054162 [Vitis vinifera]
MKKWADKKRRHGEYRVGDLVLVKLLLQQFKSLRPVHKGLVRRYEDPSPTWDESTSPTMKTRMIQAKGYQKRFQQFFGNSLVREKLIRYLFTGGILDRADSYIFTGALAYSFVKTFLPLYGV